VNRCCCRTTCLARLNSTNLTCSARCNCSKTNSTCLARYNSKTMNSTCLEPYMSRNWKNFDLNATLRYTTTGLCLDAYKPACFRVKLLSYCSTCLSMKFQLSFATDFEMKYGNVSNKRPPNCLDWLSPRCDCSCCVKRR
jgi:hypothetical protein